MTHQPTRSPLSKWRTARGLTIDDVAAAVVATIGGPLPLWVHIIRAMEAGRVRAGNRYVAPVWRAIGKIGGDVDTLILAHTHWRESRRLGATH